MQQQFDISKNISNGKSFLTVFEITNPFVTTVAFVAKNGASSELE